MSGAFHVRSVATIFIVMALLFIFPYLVAFYKGARLDSLIVDSWTDLLAETNLFLGIIFIVLALALLWGSNLASYLMSAFSLLVGIGGALVGLPLVLAGGAWMAGWLVLMGSIFVYCWWAVTFSKQVRAELARRREARRTRDPDGVSP